MLVPVLLIVLLRVNAAFVFLSLCLGDVLVQFTGNDAVSIFTGASVNAQLPASTIKLLLLLLPAVLTVLFMIGTVKNSQKYFNVLPAVGAGVLTSLFVVPQLPPGLSHAITGSDIWHQIVTYQSGLVALSTLICLLFLWMHRPKHEKEGKKGKHHK
jgi:hypothetical protein